MSENFRYSTILVGKKRIIFGVFQNQKQLENQPKSGLSCEVCKLLINGIRLLISQNKTEDEIDKYVT